MFIKQKLENLLLTKRVDSIVGNITKKKYIELYSLILEETKFLDKYNPKISERIYCIMNDIKDIIICNNETCNNRVTFIQYKHGYKKYCTHNCSVKSLHNKELHKQTCMMKYGVESYTQTDEFKKKSKLTSLDRYGVEYASKTIEFQNKCKNTSIEKYGVDHFLKSEKVKDKAKETNIKKYGVNSYTKTEDYNIKTRQTSLEKFGETHYSKTIEYKEKCKQTNLEKYGVEYAIQNQEIYDKSKISSGEYKQYILPSGKEVKIQGYENKFLDEYFNSGGLESNILIKTKDINDYLGIIWYQGLDNKRHKYYPDIYLIKENKIIEVKSTYTIKCNIDKNELKRQACLDKGLNFEFKIYSK